MCCSLKKLEKRNVSNFHLATCEKRPQIIDDNQKVNVKIQEIMADVAEKKESEEKAKKAFQCPFSSAKFKNETLGKRVLKKNSRHHHQKIGGGGGQFF